MNFKFYILAGVVALAMVAGTVYQIDKFFSGLQEIVESVEDLKQQRDDALNANQLLNTEIQRLKEEQLEKAAINADLQDKIEIAGKDFDLLKKELDLLRHPDPIKPTKTTSGKPVNPATAEVDIAWQAYCKAVPGGCPVGAEP